MSSNFPMNQLVSQSVGQFQIDFITCAMDRLLCGILYQQIDDQSVYLPSIQQNTFNFMYPCCVIHLCEPSLCCLLTSLSLSLSLRYSSDPINIRYALINLIFPIAYGHKFFQSTTVAHLTSDHHSFTLAQTEWNFNENRIGSYVVVVDNNFQMQKSGEWMSWTDIDKVWGLHHLLIDRIKAIHGAVMQQMINISCIESRESCLFSLFVRLRLLEFRIGDDAPTSQQ